MTVKVGFLGMTHLGLCSAVAAATKGFEVIAFDPDPSRIEKLQAGVLPVVEPDLDGLLGSATARLCFTAKPADLDPCDLAYVAPDVATDEEGRGDECEVERLLSVADAHLREPAVRVVLSQVRPGFMRRQRVRGPLFYQVETLIFGRAMERALSPERFIVGCRDPEALLPDALSAYLSSFGCPILRMRYESAELAKIAINAFLVSSVTTTNVLAEVCEKIGADWAEIVPALRLDARLGPHAYLMPGLGLSGGNLERDLSALRLLASQYGTDDRPIRSFVENSRYRRDWLLRAVHEQVICVRPRARIGLWGLSYKIGTGSTKNSPAVALVRSLPTIEFSAYDPVVKQLEDASNVRQVKTAREAARDCDGLVIATPWSEFAALDLGEVRREMAGSAVIDPYGVLSTTACESAGLRHFVLGRP